MARSMTLVRWEKPPKDRPRGNWQRTIKLLRSRPNEWALIVEDEEPNYAYRVSSAMKGYGAEIVTATGADRRSGGRVSVWARVVA